MEVVSSSPLRVASLVWQPRPGVATLTVVCKATFDLAPVTSPLAAEQEYPNDEENHWNDDPARSLYAPSDLAPVKPRAEVVLVGHAFAPQGKPVRSLVARLIVGEVDKSIEVFPERSFSLDGVLREGAPFARMSLRYERAAGGPDTTNPVGVRCDVRDTLGALALPNLQPPGLAIHTPNDFIAPTGFGPIAASWAARRDKLGQLAGTWSERAIAFYPLPEGLDARYFQVAPPDQQLEALRANERIVLENLHVEHARLVTSLPGVEPRATVERPGAAPRPLEFVADTLWIDTDRARCTLTWRGQVPLEHPNEAGRVVVGMAERGNAASYSRAPLAAPRASTSSNPSNSSSSPARKPGRATAVPFPPASPSPETAAARLSGPPTHDTIDPSFMGDAMPAWLRTAIQSGQPPTGAPQSTPHPPSSPAARPAPPPPRPSDSGMFAPPPFMAPPSSPGPIAPASFSTPWAAGATANPSPLEARPAPPAAPPPSPSYPNRPIAPSAPVLDAKPPREMSAIGASNAAAAASSTVPAAPKLIPANGAVPTESTPASRERLDLLWFDSALAPRLRRDKAIRELLAAGKGKNAWLVGDPTPRDGEADRDRRDVVRVLGRAQPIDLARIDAALDEAFDDEGSFSPPVAVAAGELSLRFDERESLKATITAVTPLLGADKKLREVVGAATEALESKWQLLDDVADRLTRRIEEAFRETARTLPAGYLEGAVAKLLLEGRHYRKRHLLGEPRIVADFFLGGSDAPVPAYLPGALEAHLPLFNRFRALAIVELRIREDQHETHPTALVVLALARSLKERRPSRLAERKPE